MNCGSRFTLVLFVKFKAVSLGLVCLATVCDGI